MIITLSDSTLNKHCAALLAEQLHIIDVVNISALSFGAASHSSNSLFMIDMDTQPILISRFKPNELAKYLIDSGLPRNVLQIYLVMSDVNRDKNLVTYAHELASSFTEYYQRKMTVHIPTQLSFDFTLLVPPSKNDKWEIYGFNKPLSLSKTETNSGNQNGSQSKTLVWQGVDLINYMNDAQQTYTGISYAWPSA